MIRKFQMEDREPVMKLWLETNIEAHDFVDESYWRGSFDAVSEIIPTSEVYVYETDGKVIGFIGLMENYIAGIFVDGKSRSKGIGKKLLDYAKERKNKLTLQVYQKNERAVSFYKREGFTVMAERIDENTSEIEYEMEWR